MTNFIVVEGDNGLLVTEVADGESCADAATRNAAVIIDEGPYHSYEDAYDAMMQVPDDERERARWRG